MPHYMLLIESDPAQMGKNTEEEQGQVMTAYMKYTEELSKSGKMLSGDALHPESEAVKVRVRAGKRSVTDGPFAETKEVLGGYYLINVKNREEALEWAAKCPGAEYGTMIVREIMVFPQQ